MSWLTPEEWDRHQQQGLGVLPLLIVAAAAAGGGWATYEYGFNKPKKAKRKRKKRAAAEAQRLREEARQAWLEKYQVELEAAQSAHLVFRLKQLGSTARGIYMWVVQRLAVKDPGAVEDAKNEYNSIPRIPPTTRKELLEALSAAEVAVEELVLIAEEAGGEQQRPGEGAV